MRTMNGWMTSGLAALSLLAAPLAAQEPVTKAEKAEADAGERPLAGMNAEQIATFFTLVATSPEIEAELATLVAELLEPGEPVPDWREMGVDILAELAAREGGLAGNLLRDEDEEMPTVTDLSGTAAPDLSGFSRLVLRADPPGGANEKGFTSFAPGVWLEMAGQRTQRGKALCYAGMSGLTLHSTMPVTEQTVNELFPIIVAVSLVDRLASREICNVYERVGEGYRARSFLPDGRALPALDAEPTMLRIMPASELEDFIRNSVATLIAE